MTERRTAQKAAIHGAVTQSPRPLTAHEVLEVAQRDVPSLGIATVYRQLKRLVGQQEVVAVELPGEPARYECASHDYHHHFQCEACGLVFDVPGCNAHIEHGVPDGFQVRRHEVVLYGACKDCASA